MPLFNWLAMLAILLYQRTLARYWRWRGLRCRLHPSCSHYGLIAYGKYDFFKATRMTWKRYRDCCPGSNRPVIDFP
jgi:putative component of membrane protein insertase Oxa1/YidC/SpoIIIJ protein YidD